MISKSKTIALIVLSVLSVQFTKIGQPISLPNEQELVEFLMITIFYSLEMQKQLKNYLKIQRSQLTLNPLIPIRKYEIINYETSFLKHLIPIPLKVKSKVPIIKKAF